MRLSQITFSVGLALLSGAVFADTHKIDTSNESINGIPATNLAQFAYPGLPLNDALETLRSDVYPDPDRLAKLQQQYEASLDTSDLDEKLKASSLPEVLKEEMMANPYRKAYYFQPRGSNLTQAKFKDAPLFWDSLPARNPSATTKVFGRLDDQTVLENLGGFDLDLISQAQVGKADVGMIDDLVVADYGLCGITSTLFTACRSLHLPTGTPLPISQYNMLQAQISPRQQALPSPQKGSITPVNALGLYEQAKHYQASVNPKAKLLLSISADLRKVQNVATTANLIVSYMDTWGYDGVVFDRPDFSPTEDEGMTAYEMVSAIKQAAHNKIVGVKLYGSNQFEDWDQQGVLKLQETADFMTISLNRTLNEDEIGQIDPLMSVYGPRDQVGYNGDYERFINRLKTWGVDMHKVVFDIDTRWRARYYQGELTTGSLGQISGSVDDSKASPGTFDSGSYAFYDFDQHVADWQWVSGMYTLADYYKRPADKLVASGNDRQMVSDKLVYASAFQLLGAQLELDQDNGKLTAGLIDGINHQATKTYLFNGQNLYIHDDAEYKNLHNQTKGDVVETANGIQSSATHLKWNSDRASSTITVPVVDDQGKAYNYHLLASRRRPANFDTTINNAAGVTVYYINRNKFETGIVIIADDKQNAALPPGHYHSPHPVVIQTKGWHQTYNYFNPDMVFHTVNVDIDVTQ
ncbi:glycoside hydrolase family 18 protein [Aeromonas hydrophila]